MLDRERTEIGRRVLTVTLVGNILLSILKIVVGVVAASAALVADGFHSISDIASSAGVLLAVIIAERPPDDNHHYGHGQAEPLAAAVLGIVLLITASLLGYNMIENLLAGEVSIPGRMAMYAAGASIFVKELMYRYTKKAGDSIKNQALIADAWHHRSDALSSIAALLGIGAARMGFWYLDPLAGFVVAMLVFKVGFDILQEGFVTLLGRAPDPDKMDKIREIVEEVEGVEAASEVKARYTGSKLYIDIKINVKPELSVREGHGIAAETKSRLLAEFTEAEEVLVHVNPAE
ncbi:MAG: cation diffusion facilitator family transporter [Bacillota bacterium]